MELSEARERMAEAAKDFINNDLPKSNRLLIALKELEEAMNADIIVIPEFSITVKINKSVMGSIVRHEKRKLKTSRRLPQSNLKTEQS